MSAKERAIELHSLKGLWNGKRSSKYHSKHMVDGLEVRYCWEFLNKKLWDHKFGFWSKDTFITIYFNELLNVAFAKNRKIVNFNKVEFKLFRFKKQLRVFITTSRGSGFPKQCCLSKHTFDSLRKKAFELAYKYTAFPTLASY